MIDSIQLPVAGRVTLDVGGDQVVLRTEEPIQGGGGDAGPGRDRVDAGRVDALPIEKVLGDVQQVLAGLGGGAAGSSRCALVMLDMLGNVP